MKRVKIKTVDKEFAQKSIELRHRFHEKSVTESQPHRGESRALESSRVRRTRSRNTSLSES